jgi:hypothetical protein
MVLPFSRTRMPLERVDAVALAQFDDLLIAQPGVAHHDDVERVLVRKHAAVAGNRGQDGLFHAQPLRQLVAQHVCAVHDDERPRQRRQVGNDGSRRRLFLSAS